MTQPASRRPQVHVCAVCFSHYNRRREADWLTAEGWHVCEQHRSHAERYGADTLRRKP